MQNTHAYPATSDGIRRQIGGMGGKMKEPGFPALILIENILPQRDRKAHPVLDGQKF